MWSNTARSYQSPNKLNAYLNTQVMSATREQLMLMVYDVAIVNCQKRNTQKACEALTELISALNFEYKEIALGLFRLYQYCLDLIRKQSFDDACVILKDLKANWELAIKNSKKS